MRIDLIQQALKDAGLDGWLFFDHHRRDPLAYRILNLPDSLNPTRRWYYFIPREGSPQKIVHRVEPKSLDTLPGDTIAYSSWGEQTSALMALLSKSRRVAMQYSPDCAVPYVSMVDAGTLELVRATGVEVVTSADLVQLFEARWTSDQLDSHLAAGKVMDQLRAAAFHFIGDRLRSSQRVSEWDVFGFLREGFESAGLITDHGPIVAVNGNASNPHYEPDADRNTEIRPGDLVLIDMWAKFAADPNAVFYDITWTGYCGPVPPSAMANVFAIVAGGRDAAITRVQEAAASGQTLRGFEVDDAAREHITAAGYADRFIHRTGHSIGTNVHGAGANMDNLETHDERRVIPWTCFSVEPGIYLPDFGIRSEVNVFVDDTSARVTGEKQTALVTIE